MKFQKMMRLAVLMLSFGVCTTAVQAAAFPALAVLDFGTQAAENFMVGWQFTVTSTITVTDLGKLDSNENGNYEDSSGSYIGIWDASESLIVSEFLPGSTTEDNGAFYTSITPTVLVPGTYVIGAMAFAGGEQYGYDGTIVMAAGLIWVQGMYNASNPFAMPALERTEPFAYLGPTFKFTPEPTTLLLLAIGGLATLKRRCRA